VGEQTQAASTRPDATGDGVWLNVHVASMAPGRPAPYGAIQDAGLVVRGGIIEWVGKRAELPSALLDSLPAHSGGGRWCTPGLIDCHTHIVHAGNRSEEFELRLRGASYAEIARRGGGILSTVRATRAASLEQLVACSLPRVQRLMAEGVTTLEIKSGYGLDADTELRMLRAARALGERDGLEVVGTFLGAHALPPEYPARAEEYIDFVCAEVLPAVAAAGLADAVDAFCETIGFTPAQTERVFAAARSLGLPVKLHAEHDHLEYVSQAGVSAMARAGTVAVLLPGAFYFLRETRLPPIGALREAGVPIALATDCNPGSSPAESLLLMLNMGCTLFDMTPEEALAGVTRHAAMALGRDDRLGTIEVGKQADFVLWDIDRPAELAYRIAANPCHLVVKGGAIRPGARP
jgi:imidazolonepropionase